MAVSYSLFMAFMLYQTENSSGTVWAFVTMSLVMVCLLASNNRKPIIGSTREGNALLMAAVYLVFSQLLMNIEASIVVKVVSEIVLCGLVCSYTFSEKEVDFTRLVFEVSMVFYSILLLRSSREMTLIHQRIEMFGTSLDPNFVGIPLIPALALFLDDVINCRRVLYKLLFALGLLIIVAAVLNTGSRGNFVGLAVVILFVLLSLVRSRHKSMRYLLGIGILVVALVLFFNTFFSSFIESVTRMSDFSEGADNNRFYLWRSSITVIKEHLLFGGGFGIVAKQYGHASHNTYLELLCETGIIGFVLIVFFYIRILRKAFKYDCVIGGIVMAILCQMFFLDALSNRCVWAILGWVAMLPSSRKKVFNNKEVFKNKR